MIARALGYAPLMPLAAAATAGIVADRYFPVSIYAWFLTVIAGFALWQVARRRDDLRGPLALWISALGLGAAYHNGWRNEFRADDVGHLAGVESRMMRVRGTLVEEPSVRRKPKPDPLIARPHSESSVAILSVSAIESAGTWATASGRARLTIEGTVHDLHVGDEVEVTGWLARPSGPMNPGEWDFASHLRDDRILSELRVRHSPDGVVRLNPGSWSIDRALAAVRGWGQRGIEERLAPSEGPIASALLLGDTTAMSSDEWDRYVRTGVIHVLAISGQHLVVLAAFLWFVLRMLGVGRRPAAIIVATVLLGYALMTGGRPSAVRAAVIACAVCGGILLRTRALPANNFALAWLIVLAFNPTDLFTAGFQLSFLCVAVLIWGIPRWFPPREPTPLDVLIEESRSIPERFVRGAVRGIGQAYMVTLVLGIATAPLVAYWQNVMSPSGLVIGPIAIMLTTIALISGFVLLLVWPLGFIAAPFAWAAVQSLALCDIVVGLAERMPGGCWYVGRLPGWWVVGFYVLGTSWLLAGMPDRTRIVPGFRRPLTFPIAIVVWILIGLVVGNIPSSSDELRVTFLAVDHGGCAVIETPDGRVVLYDTGSTAGPGVTKRQIAPFLWSRGIRRIDEVILSHADLDHFNGLPALLDRFPVGQVTYTPSFAEKPGAGVKFAVDAIESRGVRVRTARAGDVLIAGEVEMIVVHPPADGPAGVENVRSLVLLVRHRGHTLLLTGDLEGVGVDTVVSSPAPKVDILMAPHHGSGARGIEPLTAWARPRLAIASQGRGDTGKAEGVVRQKGIPYWSTWPDGAITIRSHSTGLTAESFTTGLRTVVRSGAGD